MKNIRFRIMLVIISILLAAFWSGCTKKTSSTVDEKTPEITEGKVAVTVVDKETQKPISDAQIVITGSENIYKTDAKGLSPEVTLKVNKDRYKRYGEELYKKAPSGTITVLVTKEGYRDYIVFNKAVYPGYAVNTLRVEMAKQTKADKTTFTKEYDEPHEVWTDELVSYCKEIKDDKPGTGANKITVNVKDEASKALKDVSIVIPELTLKVSTDKSGKCTLKPDVLKDEPGSLPVLRESSEYTIVAVKDGYIPSVVFNVEVNDGKERTLNITLKSAKSSSGSTQSVVFQPYESAWIEKAINTLKQ